MPTVFHRANLYFVCLQIVYHLKATLDCPRQTPHTVVEECVVVVAGCDIPRASLEALMTPCVAAIEAEDTVQFSDGEFNLKATLQQRVYFAGDNLGFLFTHTHMYTCI